MSYFWYIYVCMYVCMYVCVCIYIYDSNGEMVVQFTRGWSRADLRLEYQFWGHLIWAPKFKKGRKRKTFEEEKVNVLHKNKKTAISNSFYSFYFSPSTWHNSTYAQIRALDQPLILQDQSSWFHMEIMLSSISLVSNTN